jgi:hypothetical protein
MSEARDPGGRPADVLILCRRLFRFLLAEQMPFFVERVTAEPEIQTTLREGDFYAMSVLHHGTPYCLVLHLADMRMELQEMIDDHAVQCGGTRIDEGDVVRRLTHYATLRYLAKPDGRTSSMPPDQTRNSSIH